MSLEKDLEKLEERYYGEMEEDRSALIAELIPMHKADLEANNREFGGFSSAVIDRFGGAFIPYIFWTELEEFALDNERRVNLFETISAFTNSGFEEIEVKKMKSLLITYFTMEKEFELNKLFSLVIDKAHPSVGEHFHKWLDFVEKNKSSVEMYIEKFNLLKGLYPDFDLLATPVTKLREKLTVS